MSGMRSAGAHRHERRSGPRLGAAAGVAAILHLSLVLLFPLLLRTSTPTPTTPAPALPPPPERALLAPDRPIDPADIAEILLPADLPPLVPGEVVPSTGTNDD